LVVAGAAGAAWWASRIPLPPEKPLVQSTLVVDRNGAPLATLSGAVHRTDVSIDGVPQVVIDAVVATEDRGFFHHAGVDPLAIARAAVADLRGRSLEGASTITQQYVKNVYLSSKRSLARKVKEVVLAIKLERKLSKRQILERYLNTIYFGRGAYGVQAAAQAYYGKDVGQLGLPEAAYLAGIIRAPERADASIEPRPARIRRDRTLDAMVRAHRLSDAAARAAKGAPVSVVPRNPGQDIQVTATGQFGSDYYVAYVTKLLLRRFGETAVFGGGLRVRTAFDPSLQAKAYEAVYGQVLNLPGDPAGALVAIDDQGDVRAMVGGRDYRTSKVNLALGPDGGGTGRQAGSTFKAFVLSEVVREGYSVLSSTFRAPAQIILPKADAGNDWTVTNYDMEDFSGPDGQGVLDLIDATKNSVNTVYAQAMVALGPRNVVALAGQMGISSSLRPFASLVLGTADVSVIDMAESYSTLANRGVHKPYRLILEVDDAAHNVLDKQPAVQTGERVLAEAQADVTTYCLRQVVRGGTGTRAGFGRAIAGKTGTTEDYGDAWFIGYSPHLTAAVWMGYPEGESRKMTNVRGIKVNGGSFPADIFRRFMSAALAGTPADSFHDPASFDGKTLGAPEVLFPTSTTSSTTTTAPLAPVAPLETTTTVPRRPTSRP